MSISTKRFLKKTFFILLIILTSFSSGYALNDFVKSFDSKKNIKGLINIEESAEVKEKDKIEKKADFSIFWDAWKILEDKYSLEPLDYEKMVYGSISGMVDSLGDPYTVFLSPEDTEMFFQDMEGSFGGIGAEIGFRDKFLTVISPLKGSPAEKAGVFAGDKILKVDDEEISGLNIEEATLLIRGEKGTKVKLTIARDGLENLKEIEIVRDIIKIETVDFQMKENNIAYLKISQFKKETVETFDSYTDTLLAKNPRGIILDLRNNPGGYVNVLKDIAERFLKKGDVIFIEDFGKEKKMHISSGKNMFSGIPLVVLVNEGSASASEILAGALRDDNGVKLVGQKTFGKGLVQEIENLKDGSALKITVARWLTPKGTDINKGGIEPDFYVELTEEDYNKGKDPQLEKAIELLKEN